MTNNRVLAVGAGITLVTGGADNTNATLSISDDAITAAMLNPDVAGDGLVPNATTGALDINPDGTLQISSDALGLNLGNANTWTAVQSYEGANPLVFDGSTTGDGNTTTFGFTDPTGTNTITFPDASGTVMLTGSSAGGDLTGTYPNPTIAGGAGNNIVSAINNAATTNGTLNEDVLGITAGAILYGNGAGEGTELVKGTAGQILWMNAGASAPEWTAQSNLTAGSVANALTVTNGIEFTAGTDYDGSAARTIGIADDGVTAAMLNPDVAGDGLVPNATTGALDINPDGTLQISSDALGLNLGSANTWSGQQIFGTANPQTPLAPTAGNDLTNKTYVDGAVSGLAAEPFITFATGTAGLTNNRVLAAGNGIDVTIASGDNNAATVSADIDGTTLAFDGTGQIYIPTGGVTTTEIADGTIQPVDMDLADGTNTWNFAGTLQQGGNNVITTGTSAGGDLTSTYPNPTIAGTAGNNIVGAINNAATTNGTLNEDVLGITAGAILYGNASGNGTELAAGTGGYVLRMNSAGTAPEYTSPTTIVNAGTIKGRVACTGVTTQTINNANVTATSVIILIYEDPTGGAVISVAVGGRTAGTSFDVLFGGIPPTTSFINYMIIN